MRDQASTLAYAQGRAPLAGLSAAACVVVPAVVLIGFLTGGHLLLGIAPAAVAFVALFLLRRHLVTLTALAEDARHRADEHAAEASRLHDRLQDSDSIAQTHREALQASRETTALALTKLVEMRDPVTGSHLERLREYVGILVVELAQRTRFRGQIDDELIALLPHASTLHDIGKVGVPDYILHKAGRLTADEFALMKRHTTVGGATLHTLSARSPDDSFLRLAHEVALYHHERWDGGGYPFGLRAEQIPLAARIVAVADVYDALTSERPYKQAYSHATTRGHIVSQARAHFDPEVVDAFLSCEDEFVRVGELRAVPLATPPLRVEIVPDLQIAATG